MGGGLFNITMRSGTNQYHGAGYDYLANEAFDGATPFVNTLQRIRRNDYGFNGGGPVWIPKVYNGKDKTFFFYNREQYREFFVTNNHSHHRADCRLSRGQLRRGHHRRQPVGHGSARESHQRGHDLRSAVGTKRQRAGGTDCVSEQHHPAHAVR